MPNKQTAKTKKDKCVVCDKVKCKCVKDFNKDLRDLVRLWL